MSIYARNEQVCFKGRLYWVGRQPHLLRGWEWSPLIPFWSIQELWKGWLEQRNVLQQGCQICFLCKCMEGKFKHALNMCPFLACKRVFCRLQDVIVDMLNVTVAGPIREDALSQHLPSKPNQLGQCANNALFTNLYLSICPYNLCIYVNDTYINVYL